MRAWATALRLFFSLTVLAGCGALQSQEPSLGAHHFADGFRNSNAVAVDKSFGDMLRWQWQRLRAGLPAKAQTATASVLPDLTFIQTNAAAGVAAMVPAITWIGHATMLVQASGINVLTDPVFSDRASPLQWIGPKRAQPPGVAMSDLPHIDVVVISHNHYDHLDEASVRALARQTGGSPLFLVPLGIKEWLAKIGVTNVEELDWWNSYTYRQVDFYLTPAQHWSARSPFDHNRTLWGGWAVLGPAFQWYFAGDTGYSDDFAQIRQFFSERQSLELGGGFDIALVPIGAYEPRWFMQQQHVNPAEAVRIHTDLGAKMSVGVHWGTFQLTDELLDQPPKDLAAARQLSKLTNEDFFVLAIGETRRLRRRS
jgi:N-acyl-phosphatidylethanolamine-hydrolysing phospholipase D